MLDSMFLSLSCFILCTIAIFSLSSVVNEWSNNELLMNDSAVVSSFIEEHGIAGQWQKYHFYQAV